MFHCYFCFFFRGAIGMSVYVFIQSFTSVRHILNQCGLKTGIYMVKWTS